MKQTIQFLLLGSFLLLSFTSFSQEEKVKLYLSLQASPNFSYRVLSNNTDDSNVDDKISYLNNREKAAIGFRIATAVGIQVTKNWTLEAGISYVRHCTTFGLEIGEPIDPRRGFINSNNIDKAEINTCLSYLGIPMRLIYNIGTEKLRVLASFGFTPQILVDQTTRVRTYLDNDEVEERDFANLEDANGFNLSPMIGIGAQYALSNHFFLRAEGIARFGVVNVNDNSPINSYIYSSELNVGIYYNLIKKTQSNL